jgi:hypothetical protein
VTFSDLSIGNVPRPQRRAGVSGWRVMTTAVVVLQANDVFASIIRADPNPLRFAFSGILLAAALISISSEAFVRGRILLGWYAVPALLYLMMLAVSALANNLLYHIPLSSWLPSMYYFAPILVLYLLAFLNVSSKDFLVGVVIASTAVALLSLSDSLLGTGILAGYERYTVLDTEATRIVVMKNELVIALLALAATIIDRWRPDRATLLLGGASAVIASSLIVVQQSRLSLLSAAVGLLIVLLLSGRVSLKNLLAVVMPIAVLILPAILYLSAPYLSHLAALDLADPGNSLNIEVRYRTISYFWDQFLSTGGLGFGSASYGSGFGHPISNGLVNNLNVADAGAFQALFQFGVVGLISWLWITVAMVVLAARALGQRTAAGRVPALVVLGAVAGFTLLPLPVSVFTQAWTIQVGGALIFLAWRMDQERRFRNP